MEFLVFFFLFFCFVFVVFTSLKNFIYDTQYCFHHFLPPSFSHVPQSLADLFFSITVTHIQTNTYTTESTSIAHKSICLELTSQDWITYQGTHLWKSTASPCLSSHLLKRPCGMSPTLTDMSIMSFCRLVQLLLILFVEFPCPVQMISPIAGILGPGSYNDSACFSMIFQEPWMRRVFCRQTNWGWAPHTQLLVVVFCNSLCLISIEVSLMNESYTYLWVQEKYLECSQELCSSSNVIMGSPLQTHDLTSPGQWVRFPVLGMDSTLLRWPQIQLQSSWSAPRYEYHS